MLESIVEEEIKLKLSDPPDECWDKEESEDAHGASLYGVESRFDGVEEASLVVRVPGILKNDLIFFRGAERGDRVLL